MDCRVSYAGRVKRTMVAPCASMLEITSSITRLTSWWRASVPNTLVITPIRAPFERVRVQLVRIAARRLADPVSGDRVIRIEAHHDVEQPAASSTVRVMGPSSSCVMLFGMTP